MKYGMILSLALLCLSAIAQTTSTSQANEPIISLNDRVISQADFDERFMIYASQMLAQQGMQPTPELMQQLAPLKLQYVEQIATDVALLEEAERRGIEVDDEVIDEQVQAIRDNIPEEIGFDMMLQQAGFRDEAQLRMLMTEVDMISQLIEQLQEDIEISDEDIEAFYEENTQEFTTPEEVCARHILLESEEDAEEVISELESGADFAELASERSTGPSASRGGDLGCFARGQMVAPFEEAAFSAELDDVSEAIETQFGYHVLRVYDRNDAGVVDLAEVEDGIRNELLNRAIGQEVERIYNDSGVEVNRTALEQNIEESAAPAEDMNEESTDEESTDEDNSDEESTDEDNQN